MLSALRFKNRRRSVISKICHNAIYGEALEDLAAKEIWGEDGDGAVGRAWCGCDVVCPLSSATNTTRAAPLGPIQKSCTARPGCV